MASQYFLLFLLFFSFPTLLFRSKFDSSAIGRWLNLLSPMESISDVTLWFSLSLPMHGIGRANTDVVSIAFPLPQVL